MSLFFAFAPLATPLAFAGDIEAAEHARLHEELMRLAARAAWPAAEQTYQGLVALEAQGETLTRDEVYLGAQVAENNGDALACRNRLERAQQLAPDAAVGVRLRDLDQNYGPVSLRAASAAQQQLQAVEFPFEPDRRAAIQAAQAALAATGHFDGLLPRGSYTFGDVKFTIDPAVPVVTVDLSVPVPKVVAHPLALRVAPRVSLGAAYTAGLTPTLDDLAQPPSFAGAGARFAAGAELGIGRTFGAWAELGYHGLVATGDDSMHLGFVGAGGAARLGRVRVSAGGLVGGGTFAATGLADEAALASACPAGTTDPDCAWIAGVPEADRGAYRWTGSVVTPGVEGSVAVRIVDAGPALGVGIALQGGALFDPSRAWPWGGVAMELAPR